MKNLPERKSLRLDGYNYSANGAYFITICVKDMQCVLSTIVGSDALDAPKVRLTDYGKTVENEIVKMNGIYSNIVVNDYVVMPNHIHFLLLLTDSGLGGASRALLPTKSAVATYVSALKRFCNKKFGKNIWQTSYYDHIIRNEEDYILHLQYINENPKKWLMGKDKYYV